MSCRLSNDHFVAPKARILLSMSKTIVIPKFWTSLLSALSSCLTRVSTAYAYKLVLRRCLHGENICVYLSRGAKQEKNNS